MANNQNRDLVIKFGPAIVQGIANWWRRRQERKAAERDLKQVLAATARARAEEDARGAAGDDGL